MSRRSLAFVFATGCALAIATPTVSAQPSPDDAAPPPAGTPTVLARVAVIVVGDGGAALPGASRATLQISMERGLEGDTRLEIVDQDQELAHRAGKVPADAVSEARGLLSAGEELLRRGRTKDALAKLEAASAHLAEVLAWTKKEELARAQFLLAAAHAIAGDDKAALAGFVALRAWRTDYTADPSIGPEKVLPLWDKAGARVKKLAGGSIEVSSMPDGALAYVDGRFVGFTPTTVEGLPAATHYVTVKLHGHLRSVSAVKVSDRRPAPLAVTLDPTPDADQLDDATTAVASALGGSDDARRSALHDLGTLLGVSQVVVVMPEPGDAGYRGAVFSVETGARLARGEVALGDRDPADVLAELGKNLYDQVSFEPPPPPPPPAPPPKPRHHGRAAWKTWWFWGTLGAAAVVGVAGSLYLNRDTTPPLACPSGTSCGLVVLSF